MLVTLPEVDVNQATIDTISVGQVGIGPIQIGQLVLDGLDVAMTAGVAHLSNFRVTITLDIRLDWDIHIGLPDGIPDINIGDSVDLGRPSFTLDLGNVTVPGLQNFTMHIDALTAANLAMVIQPLKDLQLGAAVAEQIRAANVTLPSGGFQISGLTIKDFQADGIAVPAAGVDQATVARLHGSATGMSDVTIPGFSLQRASVQDITSQAVDVSATEVGTTFGIDAGVLRISLTVVPTARAQVDRLEITNVSGDTSIGRIELHNVVAPYELLDLTLGHIGIQSIDVPSLAAK